MFWCSGWCSGSSLLGLFGVLICLDFCPRSSQALAKHDSSDCSSSRPTSHFAHRLPVYHFIFHQHQNTTPHEKAIFKRTVFAVLPLLSSHSAIMILYEHRIFIYLPLSLHWQDLMTGIFVLFNCTRDRIAVGRGRLERHRFQHCRLLCTRRKPPLWL